MKTVLLNNNFWVNISIFVYDMVRSKDSTITHEQFTDGFERVSLIYRSTWSRVLPSLRNGGTIVLFGEECRVAFGLPSMLIHPIEKDGVTWRQLPHPTVSAEWYDNPECYDLAASLLHELYLKGKEDNGV